MIYIIVNNQFAVMYDGMSQSVCEALVTQTYNLPYQVVDESTYQSFVQANQPQGVNQ